uniref:Protein FAR1-RELATED SEQUENCE n=1 Tax=Oryza glaberrima TaxID=4538 RepID=I1PPW8_ORYGL
MATASTSGDPTAAAGEPTPSSSASAQPRQPASRISHIVRTYLDLSSNPKKRRAAPKSHPKPAAAAAGQGAPDAGDGKDGGGKAAATPSSAAQPTTTRLLRELGVRVSRYTHEERRDIVLRYMQKRSGRQGVKRATAKAPSRQALAERRRRGARGQFLGKEGAKTVDKPEEDPEVPPEVIANAGGVPIVGMVFENEEKAYEYYASYAGNVGFSVRKGLWDKTVKNVARSRVFVCSREGFRSKNEAKRPRPETRTGCPARIAIKLVSNGKYRVAEFVEDHNHQLAAPFDIDMLKSERVLTKVQPGNRNASNIPPGCKNYIRAKSSTHMNSEDLGALMDYFRRMKSDNPSFYYAIQVDENDKATNVFWADARSIVDYHYFCDVICFDTTYRSNDCRKPLALFLGMNHHRQTIIFGSAFLYDETVESFKWLLETFKSAMCGKQPKTVLTDRSAALKEALSLTWPGTIHRSCVWQIYQNAFKSLEHVFNTLEEFTHDFHHCMFDIEDDQEFDEIWNVIIKKYSLKGEEWLTKLYEDRENWALPYNRQIFFGDIKGMLQVETSCVGLREFLDCEKDLSKFFMFLESSMEKRRQEEIQADYQASEGAPRISLPLLWQAAKVYTPIIFELFRKEYELCMDCMAYSCGEFGSLSEYMITVKNKTKDQLVRFDSSDGTVACTCKKFENAGILCCHILKVYELRNVKEIRPQYFLKRWRKDAKVGSTDETNRFNFDSGTKSSVPERYAALCRSFYKIAAKAAENAETFALMASQSDRLVEEVERILQSTLANKSSVGPSIKNQLTSMVQNEYLLNSSNEVEKSTGKKKTEVYRHKSAVVTNKMQKTRKGVDFLVQGHYILGQSYGLGTSENLHNNLNQFGQASSLPTMQQQAFPGNNQLSQLQGYPSDMHALQFVGANPQMEHQNGDQGQSSIPVWDFL